MRPALLSAIVLAAACSGAEVRPSRGSCLDRSPTCDEEADAIRALWAPHREQLELERAARQRAHVSAAADRDALRADYLAVTRALYAIEAVMAEALVCGERTEAALRELEPLGFPPHRGVGLPPWAELRPLLDRTASFAAECTREH